MCRRADDASCRVASGERPTISPISANGTPNTSCSTNATRSAGVSDSSTTSSAMLTESSSVMRSRGSTAAVETPEVTDAAAVADGNGSGSHSPT